MTALMRDRGRDFHSNGKVSTFQFQSSKVGRLPAGVKFEALRKVASISKLNFFWSLRFQSLKTSIFET
jgi:hypothetical protein